jgi:hypothetical protein
MLVGYDCGYVGCSRATRVVWVCALSCTVHHYVLLTHILLHMWRSMSAGTRTTMTFAHG